MAGITADNTTVKVTPEELSNQAENVSAKITAAKRSFSEMKDTIKRTISYWKGEAGDDHRELFASLEPDMEKIFKRFTEHATDLREIAAVYTSSEAAAVSAAEPLSGDVIV